MSEFYVSLSKKEMALQITALVNNYNKLYRRLTLYSVLQSKADYFVEVMGNNVIGCAGVTEKSSTLSEIKHVCVEPDYRRKGVAKRLVGLAIVNCNTENVYMTIRDDNFSSLTMAKSLGFRPIKLHWSVDHYITTVMREKL